MTTKQSRNEILYTAWTINQIPYTRTDAKCAKKRLETLSTRARFYVSKQTQLFIDLETTFNMGYNNFRFVKNKINLLR